MPLSDYVKDRTLRCVQVGDARICAVDSDGEIVGWWETDVGLQWADDEETEFWFGH